AAHAAVQLGGLLRVLRGVAFEQRIPLALARGTGGVGAPGLGDRLRHFERTVLPAQPLARSLALVLAQRRAVRGFLARLGRRAEAGAAAAADRPRLAVVLERGVARGPGLLRIVAVDAADDAPTVGLETRRGVVGEPA